jgi:hypothetical protein
MCANTVFGSSSMIVDERRHFTATTRFREWRFSWRLAGNMTWLQTAPASGAMARSMAGVRTTASIVYGGFNRPLTIAVTDGDTEHMRCDPFARRIAKYELDPGTGQIEGRRYIYDGWSCIQEEVFNAGATEANAPSTVEKIYVNGIRIDEPILAAIDGDLDGNIDPGSLNRLPWTDWPTGPPPASAEPVDFVYYYCENGTVGNIMALVAECTEGEEPGPIEEPRSAPATTDGSSTTPASGTAATPLTQAQKLGLNLPKWYASKVASLTTRVRTTPTGRMSTMTTLNGARDPGNRTECVKPLEYYRYQAYGTPDVYPIVDTDGNGWEDTPWTLADNNALMVSNRAARADYGRWSLHCNNEWLFQARRWEGRAGLLQVRHRDASGSTGIFIERDSVFTLNRLQMLRQSPPITVDPSGLTDRRVWRRGYREEEGWTNYNGILLKVDARRGYTRGGGFGGGQRSHGFWQGAIITAKDTTYLKIWHEFYMSVTCCGCDAPQSLYHRILDYKTAVAGQAIQTEKFSRAAFELDENADKLCRGLGSACYVKYEMKIVVRALVGGVPMRQNGRPMYLDMQPGFKHGAPGTLGGRRSCHARTFNWSGMNVHPSAMTSGFEHTVKRRMFHSYELERRILRLRSVELFRLWSAGEATEECGCGSCPKKIEW